VKTTLKIEELAMLGLSIWMFSNLNLEWWWFLLFFLSPDLGMLGYLANDKVGAFTYNLVHHKGIAILVFIMGGVVQNEWLQFTGIIIFGHASFDRVLGYGLKYPSSFHDTHLGRIGKK